MTLGVIHFISAVWSQTQNISEGCLYHACLMIKCRPRENAEIAQSQGELEPSGSLVSVIQGPSQFCPRRCGKSKLEGNVLSDLLFPCPRLCRSTYSSVLAECTDGTIKTNPGFVYSVGFLTNES